MWKGSEFWVSSDIEDAGSNLAHTFKIVGDRLQNTYRLLLKSLVEGVFQKSYIFISKPLNSQKYATNLKCVDELKICFRSRVTVDCVKKWRRILGVTKCKKPSGSLQSLYRSKISLRKKAYWIVVDRKRCKMEANFESRWILKILVQSWPTLRKCSKIVSNRLQNTFGLLL